MRTRIERINERIVIYDAKHWCILKKKRALGVAVLEHLERYGIKAFIFGSVARGDVHRNSDIEVVISSDVHINRLETVLSQRFYILEKQVIMATPTTAIKINYQLNNDVTVVIPFVPLNRLEQEFYIYGGQISLPHARDYRRRVPGVNKRFCLVIPMEDGHSEIPVIGREQEVARYLGISLEVILDRKRHLIKRDEKGRTGVYLKLILDPEEDVYKVIKDIADSNPVVRRHLKERGIYHRIL